VVPTDTGVATFLPSSLYFSLHPPARQCSSGPTSSRLSHLLRSHHRRFSVVIYSSPCEYFADTSGEFHEARVRCGLCGRRKCGFLRGACRPRAGWARFDARESSTGLVDPVVGRYVYVELEGVRNRVYFEEVGTGVPLLCLHTAGADSRQYRLLLCGADITSRWRVISFDLPYHGRSMPPDGWWEKEYLLTTRPRVVFAVPRAMSRVRFAGRCTAAR
jgi:hypothetical protein